MYEFWYTVEYDGDKNDGGECHSWTSVISEFEKLWENGERE